MHIHVNWEGPYTYDEALSLKNEHTDYGVYQIYGTHPIYGHNVLLYIGKAARQTFGLRLSQEFWGEYHNNASNVSVYLGRLGGYECTPSGDEWESQITIVERLLILSHMPAGNSSGLNVLLDENYHDVQVLNWGKYRDLLPEASGARYSNRYESADGYSLYGEEMCKKESALQGEYRC